MDELILTFNSPLTEEDWDVLEDVDFDCTNNVWFHTKHGKDVEFAKVVRCADCVHRDIRYEWHGDYNCRLHHEPKSLDFFCADGKGREA